MCNTFSIYMLLFKYMDSAVTNYIIIHKFINNYVLKAKFDCCYSMKIMYNIKFFYIYTTYDQYWTVKKGIIKC